MRLAITKFTISSLCIEKQDSKTDLHQRRMQLQMQIDNRIAIKPPLQIIRRKHNQYVQKSFKEEQKYLMLISLQFLINLFKKQQKNSPPSQTSFFAQSSWLLARISHLLVEKQS